MTSAPRVGGTRKRTARDLRTVGVALALLALSGAIWVWMSRNAVERRARVLASIPAFPARGQESRPRVFSDGGTVRLAEPPPSASPEPRRPAKPDPLTSFVLKPAHDVTLVHVNALLNTPLFERIKGCLPAQWSEFTGVAERMGIDMERDVDRLAVTADGMAMSGFFEGKPIARNIAGNWPDLEERQYRGH